MRIQQGEKGGHRLRRKEKAALAVQGLRAVHVGKVHRGQGDRAMKKLSSYKCPSCGKPWALEEVTFPDGKKRKAPVLTPEHNPDCPESKAIIGMSRDLQASLNIQSRAMVKKRRCPLRSECPLWQDNRCTGEISKDLSPHICLQHALEQSRGEEEAER